MPRPDLAHGDVTGVHGSRFLLPNSRPHDSRVRLVQDSICDPENPEIHVVGPCVPMPLPDLALGNVTGVHRPRILAYMTRGHDHITMEWSTETTQDWGTCSGPPEEQIQTSPRQAQAIIFGPTRIFLL